MPSSPGGAVIRLVLPSDPFAVREALRKMFGGDGLRSLHQADRGTAELVLAEVLNNVVEHAYGRADGRIEITIRVLPGALSCKIVDHGGGMPEGLLPQARPLNTGADEELPEGGFGWHLIRALATDLDYRRVGNRNELSFRLEAEQ